jgi:hypothetical protein
MAAEPGDNEIVAEALAHWRQDADHAGSRDPSEQARFPEADPASFRTLRADLAGLLAEARAGK